MVLNRILFGAGFSSGLVSESGRTSSIEETSTAWVLSRRDFASKRCFPAGEPTAYFLATGPLGSGVRVPRLKPHSAVPRRYRSSCTCGTRKRMGWCAVNNIRSVGR
jgi:hypothetical protein